jgi:serine/threonine protein kinase
MHLKNYIHRDIKPDNIMMGLGDATNIVHMIDFGLTRLVIDPKTGKHIPFTSGKNLIGTCRYVSINSHLGFELSRRDDLTTLGYVVINFLKGVLPWQSVSINKQSARYRKVGKVKSQYSS